MHASIHGLQVHVSTQYFVDHLEKRAGSLFSDTCFTPQLLYWIFNPPFIIFAIPVFEFLIQPIFARRELFPSTLKRVGVAMCISFVATFMFLILDIVGHAITPKSETAGPICMFLYTNDRDQSSSHNNDGLTLSGWSLVIPILLGTIGEMIGYIGGMLHHHIITMFYLFSLQHTSSSVHSLLTQ